MITVQSILAFVLVVIQLCVAILNIVNLIQSIVYNHRKEICELKYHIRNIQHHEE